MGNMTSGDYRLWGGTLWGAMEEMGGRFPRLGGGLQRREERGTKERGSTKLGTTSSSPQFERQEFNRSKLLAHEKGKGEKNV